MQSTAKMRPARISLAEAMQSWPTGPQPKIATVLPGSISASSAPKYAVGKMSDRTMACSSLTSSGIFTRLAAAKGTRANSACRPSNGPAVAGPPKNAVPASFPFGFALSHCA